MSDSVIEPGSELDIALQRALEAANLRAGDSAFPTTASVAEDWEPSAAEAGDLGGTGDAD